ncbi:MAG: hypothetical protein QOF01_3168, partial [Thermomicrobiales bacterium]|nr:hypothetical protein [Thermomicrobiales bacterium]
MRRRAGQEGSSERTRHGGITYPPADLGDSETPEAVAQRVADRVNQQLQGKPPAGAIHHAEGPTDEGGWWIFDVWALDQDFET